MKQSLKRFGQWIGRFVLQVHLGPRFGSLGARMIGPDPAEEWEQRRIEAEELDRKKALGPDDPRAGS